MLDLMFVSLSQLSGKVADSGCVAYSDAATALLARPAGLLLQSTLHNKSVHGINLLKMHWYAPPWQGPCQVRLLET